MGTRDDPEGMGTELDRYSLNVEARLASFLDDQMVQASEYHPFIGEIYNSLREFCLRGGKRIASYTTSLVARGYGLEPRVTEEICEAVELYRHSILVHDDLVDGDRLRRGKPTFHVKYSEKRGDRFGLGSAVFAGNILYSLCIRRVMDSGLDVGAVSRTCNELARANRDVNESQILDLYLEGTRPDAREWGVMAAKRAASLFGTTLRIGAIVSGAEDDVDTLQHAGEEMGFVFDIQDDIIDTFATHEEYGRGPGSDLRTLKRPLHILLAMGRGEAGDVKILEDPHADLEKVKALLLETGALEEAKRIAEERSGRALELIASTDMNVEAKDRFGSLMDYMRSSLKWYDT